MKGILSILGCAALLMIAVSSFSQEKETHKKPSCCTYVSPSLPPVGIMGDHHHHKGGWMASYRYKSTSMTGLQNGTKEVSESSVLQNHMMSPISMDMQGHMVGVMYGLSRLVTVMAMMPYMRMNMDMKTGMGMTTAMSSSGLGDLKITSIVEIWRQQNTILLGNIGVSLPTGSIDQRGDMLMGENLLLPYTMQLGSGSVGMLTSFTFSHTMDKLTLGLQYNGNVRLNNNDKDYRLGNLHNLNLWTAFKPNQWISAAIRLNAAKTGEIDGMATELNMMMSPLNNVANSGRSVVNGNVGINIYPQIHQLENHVIGVEFGTPLYQETTGTQMINNNTLTLGWQYSF